MIEEDIMTHGSLWRAITHSIVVVLVLSTGLALFVPSVHASAGWIGQSGGSTANAINYTSYGWINSDQAEIRPFSVATTSITIYQDFWKSDFTSGVDLDQARLYYKTNSSSFGTANDGSWTVVNGTITAIGSSNDDRATFTLSATAGTDIMFYIRYTDGGADAYGFPTASSSWTTLPSSQSHTYKIRFNSSATYNAKRIDGLTHDWQDNEKLGTVGSTDYYLTWDDTNLFVRISGGFADSDQIQVAIDTNPGTNDVTGSSATGEFARATFAGFLTPDYLIRSNGASNLERFTRSGTSWGSGTSIYSAANLWRSGATAEIRIPRSEIGSLATASAFGVYFWLANSSNNLYSSYGTDNPTSCSGACRMRTETGFTSSGSGITPSSDQKADHNNSETRTLGITALRNLYVSNGTGTTASGVTTATGNLTIASGSSLNLATGDGNHLNVGGSVDIAGTLTLPVGASDLRVGGNWTRTGTFTPNGSIVEFNGTAAQTVNNSTTFARFTVSNTAADVSLAGDQTVTTDINITGRLNLSTFNLNGASPLSVASGATLTLGSADGINSGTGSGNIRTSGARTFNAGANYIFNGAAAQVTGTGFPGTVNNLTINNGSGVTLSGSPTVNGTLTLTNGRLTLGTNTLTLGPSAPAVAGTPNSSNMVVADGAGALCKQFTANDSYDYPIGDNTSGPDYSPVTSFSVSGSTYTGASVCFRVIDADHPDRPSNATTYITRYWTGTLNGTISGLSYGATFNFVSGETLGAGSMSGKKWNGGPSWTELGAVSGTTFSGSSLTSFSDFTAFTSGVLAVTLADFYAVQQADAILVTWETASELNNRGFNLYRGTSPDGWDRQLNATLIPSQSQGSPSGFVYTWEDRADLMPGTTYYYWLQDVDTSGAMTMHGPVSVDYSGPTAVTLNGIQASPAAGAGALPWLWVVAAAAGAALGASRMRR